VQIPDYWQSYLNSMVKGWSQHCLKLRMFTVHCYRRETTPIP